MSVDLAWAAGMFEGQGSVRINTRTARNHGALLVDMVNVQPDATAFFAGRWGGYHRQVTVAPPRRSYWRWRLASRAACRDVDAVDVRAAAEEVAGHDGARTPRWWVRAPFPCAGFTTWRLRAQPTPGTHCQLTPAR